jgi:IMP dehydrogenase
MGEGSIIDLRFKSEDFIATHLKKRHKFYAKFRGQASKDFQDEFYGGLKDKTVAEGEAFWAEVTGTAQELIDKFLGGLRSGMTYGGARSIKELQRKAEFVEVTNTYLLESSVRKD